MYAEMEIRPCHVDVGELVLDRRSLGRVLLEGQYFY